MTSYTLSGYLSVRPVDVGICLPCFRRPGSNRVFVQELDDEFRVRGFIPVHPERFWRSAAVAPEISLKIYDAGLIAVALAEAQVVVGTRSELERCRPLRDINAPPFLLFELAGLLRDGQLLETALAACGAAIGHRLVGERWIIRERTASKRVIQGGSPRDYLRDSARFDDQFDQSLSVDKENSISPEIARLIEAVNDPNWLSQWYQIWNAGGSSALLIDVAAYWMAHRRYEAYGVDELLQFICRHTQRRSQVVSQALAGRLTVLDTGVAVWATLWHYAGVLGLPSMLTPPGLRFLERRLDKGVAHRPKTWMRVWGDLWDWGSAPRDQLIALAEGAFPTFGKRRAFLHQVAMRAVTAAEGGFAASLVRRELEGLGPETDRAQLFLARLARGGHATPHEADAAYAWLAQAPNPNWLYLWRSWIPYFSAWQAKDLILRHLQREPGQEEQRVLLDDALRLFPDDATLTHAIVEAAKAQDNAQLLFELETRGLMK